MDINEFKKLPIMGILRGVESRAICELTRTIIASGLKTIEITMNTAGAPDLIRQMKDEAKGALAIGAGTVLSMNDLNEALFAGASFIVLPTCNSEVVEYCLKNKVPVFPGALTPQEIHKAWSSGATMVKVFPARFFGPAYFKEIKGPFADIELLACGGVNRETIQSYFSSGASAVAFGASVFKKEWLKERKFECIKEAIEQLIESFK